MDKIYINKRPRLDITGKKFGKLTATKPATNGSNKRTRWECLCDCGKICVKNTDTLVAGNTRSCGCIPKHKVQFNKDYSYLIDQKINKLTVLKETFDSKGRKCLTCKCDCGTIKDILSTRIANNKVVSCGCYRIEVVKSITGEKHHNWNPDKSTEEKNKDRTQRRHKEWDSVKWRKAVFLRDGFRCQLCGNKRNLNSHHLNCWSLFKDQRYDVNNGITLCNACHRSFHKKYGLKCTKEKFEEFKENYGKHD